MKTNQFNSDSEIISTGNKEWIAPEIREISKSKIQGSNNTGDDGGGFSTGS